MSSRNHHIELSRRDRVGVVLGWISLLLLLAGLFIYAANNVLVLSAKISLAAGAAAGIVYLALRGKAVTGVLVSSRAGEHAIFGSFTIMLLAILGLLNYMATRHHFQFDLTRQKLYSLSPQTGEIARTLGEDVRLTAFYQLSGRRGSDGQRARALLRQYEDLSPKIKLSVIDPVADPARAEAMGMRFTNVIWVESGGRKEEVYSADEQELTSAILKVTRPGRKKVYFLFGHGEMDIEDTEYRGLSEAKRLLEKINYEVSKLILQTVQQVPSDAAMVVVAGPKNGIPPNEQQMLANYLNGGGKMLLMLDARVPVPEALVKPWGVEIGNNIVIDPRLRPGQALVEKFESHRITRGVQTGLFLLARSVSAAAAPPSGITVTSLAKTPELAWGETKLDGPYQRDDADLRGPVSLGVVATREQLVDTSNQKNDQKKSTRLVVIGNSWPATNNAFRTLGLGDADLFLNTINWLAQEEALVNIPPKDPERNQIFLTDAQGRWIFLITLLVVPFGVLLGGVFIWWRRR